MTTLLAMPALLGACGGDSPRERVDAYLERATALQQEWAPEFKRANEAYVRFSERSLTAGEAISRLSEAERDIRAARSRLAGLEHPAEADRLHGLLLKLYDQNLEFAGETTDLARYVPAAEEALQPLGRVNDGLQRRLRTAQEPVAQAGALRRFVAGLDGILENLRGLTVPPVMDPAHRDQVRRLDGTRDVARQLQRALTAADAPRVARTLRRFRRTVSSRRVSTRLADRAIRQYNRRQRELNRTATDIRREEARLEGALD